MPLTPVTHLVFLLSLDVTVKLHKSQYKDFALLALEQGLFIETTAGISPAKTFYFDRVVAKNTIQKCIWRKNERNPISTKDYDIMMDFHNKDIYNTLISGNSIKSIIYDDSVYVANIYKNPLGVISLVNVIP